MKLKEVIFMFLALFAMANIISGCQNQPSAEDTINQELQSLIEKTVADDSSIKSCSVAVLRGDGEFYWAGAAGRAYHDNEAMLTVDTPYFLASITKTYTATLAMIMVEEGRISLDDPIFKYLPEERILGLCEIDGVDYSSQITLQHLLSNTSGIADYYSDEAEDGKSLFDRFTENPQRLWTVEETIDTAQNDLEAHFAPGEGCHYSDTNYQLIGLILEALSGKGLHELYNDYIFTPLELERTWLVNHPRVEGQEALRPADIYLGNEAISILRYNGSYWADGGMISTAQDNLLFFQALLDGELISQESLSLMQDWRSIHFPMKYGMGLDRISIPGVPTLWGHSGSTSSFMYYHEDSQTIITGTLNLTDANRSSFMLIGQVLSKLSSFGRAGE